MSRVAFSTKYMKEKIKEYSGYIGIILVVILVRIFVVTPIRVNGASMETTLQNGNYMILKKYDKDYSRFDIVVIDYKGDKLIKRIVGLPKEDIEYKENKLYIEDELLENEFGYGFTNDFKDYCGEDEYFVLGDNREDSTDSRIIGCVSKKDILGTTNFIVFPFNKFGNVK